MNSESTKALITGGLRSIMQTVPLAGGALAQAWSEYETFKNNERINEFFEALKARLKSLEDQSHKQAVNLKHVEDVAFMLERIVESIRREQSAVKRSLYPVVLVNLLLDKPETTRDERVAILESLDSLTDSDMDVLLKFKNAGWNSGDILSETHEVGFAPAGNDDLLSRGYETKLGPIITSVAKLEGRGLIIPTVRLGGFQSSGKEGAWYNQFRYKAWKLLPVGLKLLQAAGL